MEPHKPDRTEEFIRLLGEHSRKIHDYIYRLVLDMNDADDIFQETNMILWREFEKYESGTNFRAWSYQIALYQVLTWRKRQRRDRLTFSESFLTLVSNEMVDGSFSVDDRVEYLSSCLMELPEHLRELIALRYEKQLDVDSIAAELRRTVDAVYRSLSRIRMVLHQCVIERIRRVSGEGGVR